MEITVRFHGGIRAIVGEADMRVTVPDDCSVKVLIASVEQVVSSAKIDAWRGLWACNAVRVLVNGRLASWDSCLAEGDVVSLVTPLIGG